MKIKVSDAALQVAAQKGMDEFVQVVVDAISHYAGGELTAEALGKLEPDQITLWAYVILRDELCDGGFIQLIHNGYGPFFFLNPFAKAMRLWGLKEFRNSFIKRVNSTNFTQSLSPSRARTRNLWRSTNSIRILRIWTTSLWSERKRLRLRLLII